MGPRQGSRATSADATSVTKRIRKFEKNGSLATAGRGWMKGTRDMELRTGINILDASVSRAELHTGRLLDRKRRDEINRPGLGTLVYHNVDPDFPQFGASDNFAIVKE